MKNVHYILTVLLTLWTWCLSLNVIYANEKQQDVWKPVDRKFSYFFDAAVAARLQGDLSGAIDLLTECYYIDSQSAAVAEEFSKAYNISGDAEKSLMMAERAVSLDKTNVWYKMHLASLHEKMKQLDKAAMVYEEISKQYPEMDEIDYRLAMLYMQMNRPEKSLETLERLERKVGIDVGISSEKYHIYEMAGERRKAEKELERLCKKYPYNMDYQLALSQCYYNHGKRSKALEIERKVRKAEPRNEKLKELEMVRYRMEGDTVASDSMLLATLRDTLYSADKKMEMLSAFLNSPDPQDVATGEHALQCMLKQYPDNELLHMYNASFMMMQKRYKEALVNVKELIRLRPDNEVAWAELADLYGEMGDTVQSQKVLLEMVDRFPNQPLFVMQRGLMYAQMQKYELAIQDYRKTLSLMDSLGMMKDKEGEVYMNMGDVYGVIGKMDSAFYYYEKALELMPDDALLLNNYAYYLSLQGLELDKAEQMSAKAVASDPNNVSYLDTYAWIFWMKGDEIMAKIYIQQAYDKGGKDVDVVMEHYKEIMK